MLDKPLQLGKINSCGVHQRQRSHSCLQMYSPQVIIRLFHLKEATKDFVEFLIVARSHINGKQPDFIEPKNTDNAFTRPKRDAKKRRRPKTLTACNKAVN